MFGRHRLENRQIHSCRRRTNAPLSELCAGALGPRGRKPTGWSDPLCARRMKPLCGMRLKAWRTRFWLPSTGPPLPDEKLLASEIVPATREALNTRAPLSNKATSGTQDEKLCEEHPNDPQGMQAPRRGGLSPSRRSRSTRCGKSRSGTVIPRLCTCGGRGGPWRPRRAVLMALLLPDPCDAALPGGVQEVKRGRFSSAVHGRRRGWTATIEE